MKKQAGYSHYWGLFADDDGVVFSDAEWKKILTAARKIIRKAEADGIAIRGPFGEGKPVLTPTKIALNGDAASNLSHESFVLENRPKDFNFCKTAQKPYDKVVVSILAAVDNIQPEAIRMKSDGGLSVFSPANTYKAASQGWKIISRDPETYLWELRHLDLEFMIREGNRWELYMAYGDKVYEWPKEGNVSELKYVAQREVDSIVTGKVPGFSYGSPLNYGWKLSRDMPKLAKTATVVWRETEDKHGNPLYSWNPRNKNVAFNIIPRKQEYITQDADSRATSTLMPSSAYIMVIITEDGEMWEYPHIFPVGKISKLKDSAEAIYAQMLAQGYLWEVPRDWEPFRNRPRHSFR
jgi:hypothetical protein